MATSSIQKCLVCVTTIIAIVSGCATPHIHESDSFINKEGIQTLAIDAKQRVVIVGHVPSWIVEGPYATSAANAALIGKFQTVACAEPSPDALSALSTSIGAGVSDPKVAVNFALAQAESTASIGLRTQSIQLLRDGMYRLCEGYAAGAIDSPEFNRQQRRYQNLMLSLLAIEQLTGAVVPRQAGLGEGSASASVGDKADEAAGNLAKSNADLASAQSALSKAKATKDSDDKACSADSTSSACGKSADDKTAVDNAQVAHDKADLNQRTAEEALRAARAAVRTAASGARVSFSDATKTNQITEGTARYIAEATRTIVSTTLLASFAQEECSRLWDYINPLDASERKSILSGTGGNLSELMKACTKSQESLIHQSTLFTPQYPASLGPPLQVLGAQEGVTLAATAKPVKLYIIGGISPYHVSETPSEWSKEVSWSLTGITGNYELKIERLKGATKSGKVSVYVLDSTNANVEIPVVLGASG